MRLSHEFVLCSFCWRWHGAFNALAATIEVVAVDASATAYADSARPEFDSYRDIQLRVGLEHPAFIAFEVENAPSTDLLQYARYENERGGRGACLP